MCGKWPTFFFTVGTVSIGVASSFAAGIHWLLWPLEGLMIVVISRNCPSLAGKINMSFLYLVSESVGSLSSPLKGPKAKRLEA